MLYLVYPDTLYNMAVQALGNYVSQFMKRMIENPSEPKGADGKYHHYQGPCSRLEDMVTRVPTDRAREVTLVLIGHVNKVYTELVAKPDTGDACEEISPLVLKSVIHPCVKSLDCIRYSDHREILDYYKIQNCDLIYKTLPLLRGLKELKLGVANRTDDMRLEVEGFQETLETFSSHSFRDSDLEILAINCKKLKRLDISCSDISDKVMLNILQFDLLEELNLCNVRNLSNTALLCMLTIFRRKLLKKFGCSHVQTKHIQLISNFSNLTSLVVSHVQKYSMTPLKELKHLRAFALRYSRFCLVGELLNAIGSQLSCLNFTDVADTDFDFIRRNCTALECLHLCFSESNHLHLPQNWNLPGAIWHPSVPYPSVQTLQIFMTDLAVVEYIVSRFRNLRTLFFSNNFDKIFLEGLLQRVPNPHLQKLYWGDGVAVTFDGKFASIKKFYSEGVTGVQNIVIE